MGPLSDLEDAMLEAALERNEYSWLSCQIMLSVPLDGLVVRRPADHLRPAPSLAGGEDATDPFPAGPPAGNGSVVTAAFPRESALPQTSDPVPYT